MLEPICVYFILKFSSFASHLFPFAVIYEDKVLYPERRTMLLREQLTNEIIKKNFASDFELANYAIKLAKYSILEGAEFNLGQFLDEIRKNPHKYSNEEIQALLEGKKQTKWEEEQKQ